MGLKFFLIIVNWFHHLAKFSVEKRLTTSHPRSPQWGRVEREHLANHSTCAACGCQEKLQVHHVKPFHLHPELELDESNLVTLCMSPGVECHLYVGHGDSWRAYNPDVLTDAAKCLVDPSVRSEVITDARRKRLTA